MLGLITYSLILLALTVGVWRRPAIGMAAVLCLYGLKQWGQSSNAFLADYRQISNYGVGVLVILGVTLAAFKRSCLFCRVSVTAWLVGLLYLYAFITIAWAPDWQKSLQQWGIHGPYLITVVLLAPLLLVDLRDVRAAFLWTLVTGVTICTLALTFGHWGIRGLLLYGDISDSETNPLALASMAGTVLLIAGLSVRSPNGIPMRVFVAACIPIALAVILRSGSRGQLLATGAGLIVAWSIGFRPRDGRSFGALVLAALVVLGLGFWASTRVDIDPDRWSSTQSQEAFMARLEAARTLLGAATDNAFTALFGLGNSSAFHILGIYPHITALEVLAEEGLLGAALYFTVILLALRSIKRIAGVLQLRHAHRNTLAILAGLFVFELIISWKQGSLLSSVYVFAYAIILGRMEDAVNDDMVVTDSLIERQPASTLSFPNLMR